MGAGISGYNGNVGIIPVISNIYGEDTGEFIFDLVEQKIYHDGVEYGELKTSAQTEMIEPIYLTSYYLSALRSI